MKLCDRSLRLFLRRCLSSLLPFSLTLLLTLLLACQSQPLHPVRVIASPAPPRPSPVPVHKVANAAQLVDIQPIAPAIVLDLRYATANNFLHKPVYPQARCLLRAAVAEALAQVQSDLAAQGLGLKVYDCYRPLSVQKQMWALVPDNRYVAHPATGSRHNRGSAVDLTLVDRKGQALEMPTDFDDFSERASLDYAAVSPAAALHRQQLQAAMTKRGFTGLATEWWHFDAPNWAQFSLLDVAIESIPNS